MRYRARFLKYDGNAWDYHSSISEMNIDPHPQCSIQRAKVLVYEHNTPILLLNVFVEVDKDGCVSEGCFKQILSNDEYVVIIFGQHVHIVNILLKQVKSLHLGDFIGHMYPVPNFTEDKLGDNFLVTTYCYVFFINVAKGIIWKSDMCGIDGVIITNVNNGVITGLGEWDPPGGWLDFKLLLSNGVSVRTNEG